MKKTIIYLLILIIFFSSCRSSVEIYIENYSGENILITCYPNNSLYYKDDKKYYGKDDLVDILSNNVNYLVNVGIDIKEDSISRAYNIILLPNQKLLLCRIIGFSAPPRHLADKLEIRYYDGFIMAEQGGVSLLFHKTGKEGFTQLYSLKIQ